MTTAVASSLAPLLSGADLYGRPAGVRAPAGCPARRTAPNATDAVLSLSAPLSAASSPHPFPLPPDTTRHYKTP